MDPVSKVSIIDQVVEKIQASIISGIYRDGHKLPAEQTLSRQLNVGRSTVREAFRVLQTMGYIELKPGRGAFVHNQEGAGHLDVRLWFQENAPQLKDFIEVREAIETLAMRIAIEKGSDEEYAHVAEINQQFTAAMEAGDVAAMALLDETFHKAIVAMTRNSLLINISDLVATEFKKYRSISFSVPANCESAVQAHARIVDAMQRRDAQVAVASIAYHLHKVITDMDSLINI